MEVVVYVPKSVLDEAVDQFAMPQAIALARSLQEVGRASHAFHPACHYDPGFAHSDRLRRHDHGLQARAANLVDRRRAHRVRNAGSNRSLPGRRLSEACRQDAAHVNFVHSVTGEVNSLQSLGDGQAPELRRGDRAKHAVKTPQRRSHGTDDDRVPFAVHRNVSQLLCSMYCFTLPMNRSAVAPSITRWSNERLR